jgi:hypothetical protein
VTSPRPASKNQNALKMKPKPIQANKSGKRPGHESTSSIQAPHPSKHQCKILLTDLLKNRPGNMEILALTKWNLDKEVLEAKISMHEIVESRRK